MLGTALDVMSQLSLCSLQKTCRRHSCTVPLAMQPPGHQGHESLGTSSRGSGRLAPWLGSRNLSHHGTRVKRRSHLLASSSWTLAPLLECLKHWVHVWAAYANYLKGGLGGDDNGKYLAVTCDAALWIIQLVSCEASQSGGLSWVVLNIFRKK